MGTAARREIQLGREEINVRKSSDRVEQSRKDSCTCMKVRILNWIGQADCEGSPE